MSQTLLPDGDSSNSKVRFSSGSVAYSLLNTGTTSGYVYGPDVNSGTKTANGYSRVTLQNPETPITGDITLNAYVCKSDSSAVHDSYTAIEFKLSNGTYTSSSVLTKTFAGLTTTTTLYTVNIPESTWGTYFSNWENAMIQVVFYSRWASQSENNSRCYYLELVVPDASIMSGLEMGMMF